MVQGGSGIGKRRNERWSWSRWQWHIPRAAYFALLHASGLTDALGEDVRGVDELAAMCQVDTDALYRQLG